MCNAVSYASPSNYRRRHLRRPVTRSEQAVVTGTVGASGRTVTSVAALSAPETRKRRELTPSCGLLILCPVLAKCGRVVHVTTQ